LNNWSTLQKNIQITFRDLSLLQNTFIHSSYFNENPDSQLDDNERLEFLGDAVLNFVVAEKIFNTFPDLNEGSLTEIRVSLIREETLAQLASELDLGKYLYLGKGEESTGGRNRQSNLADTFEALIGAIFLDQELNATRQFILSRLDKQIKEIDINGIGQNYKAKLQEFSQGQPEYRILPVYRLINESGPDHDKQFDVEVLLDHKVVGTGIGKSKKAAEMEAARSACQNLQIE
jgi:ribonuclease III